VGKRQHRYYENDLEKYLPELQGKQVSVIKKNSTVVYGSVTRAETSHIILKDMLRKNLKIAISEIEEIVFDRESNF
jgi:hypothetical protein